MTEDIADLTDDEVRAYIAREYGDQLAACRRPRPLAALLRGCSLPDE